VLSHLFNELVSRANLSCLWRERRQKNLIASGMMLERNGDVAAAEQCYRQGIEIDANNQVNALHQLGRLLGQSGKLDEALHHLSKAQTLAPHAIEIKAELGTVYLLLRDFPRAEACFRQVLATTPDHTATLHNLGNLLKLQGNPVEALKLLTRARVLAPHFLPTFYLYISTLLELERYQQAYDELIETKQLVGDIAEVEHGIATALQKLDRPYEALPYYHSALRLLATDANIWDNLGTCQQELSEYTEARRCYDKAIELAPANPVPRWHRSLLNLLTGRYAEGWSEYELRLKGIDYVYRQHPFPQWSGENLTNKAILVYAEQGIGDEIMFSSCIPDLMSQAREVIIECTPKLIPIFQRSFPKSTVFGVDQKTGSNWINEWTGKIDFCIPIGSLPSHFRSEASTFPTAHGFLHADEEKSAKWKRQLGELGSGLKVGISWRGGIGKTRRNLRSLDEKSLLMLLEKCGDAQIINLQYDTSPQENAALSAKSGKPIHYWEASISDFDETAALVNSLDLVITVCTTIAHLGGALGKQVLVMVPQHPEWRYGHVGEHMIWYPSVQLFRQSEWGQWHTVIDQVIHHLDTFRASAKPDSTAH